MPSVQVAISRFVDEYFPGIVEFTLVDALGTTHTFVDKLPIVTEANLGPHSTYPQPGALSCDIIGASSNAAGKAVSAVEDAAQTERRLNSADRLAR